jgi:CubicO group peptidase (beta-lactamase class C family)
MPSNRRQVLLGAGAAVIAHSPGALSAGTDGWSRIDPQEAGFAPGLEALLDKAIAEKRIWNLHGLVVVRHDRLVLERYFDGEDQARGIGDIGHVTFKPDTIHDLRSCSKSIVGLLYGIALQQGKVPPPEAPLSSGFPEYADLAAKEGRDRLTVQHVLTMTMGTDWDESSLLYSDPRNSETAMDAAPDRYRYILSGASSIRPVPTGPIAAARLLCWRALSPRVRAKPCMNSRAKTCSIRLAWVRRNGRPGATANLSPRQERACRSATSRVSA